MARRSEEAAACIVNGAYLMAANGWRSMRRWQNGRHILSANGVIKYPQPSVSAAFGALASAVNGLVAIQTLAVYSLTET